MAPIYFYNNLGAPDHIRLLEVHGSIDISTPIYCNLIEASIHNPPEYEAISYAWQVQRPTRTIICDGAEITVTENCYRVLCRFRPIVNDQSRRLWIDSVCIN